MAPQNSLQILCKGKTIPEDNTLYKLEAFVIWWSRCNFYEDFVLDAWYTGKILLIFSNDTRKPGCQVENNPVFLLHQIY